MSLDTRVPAAAPAGPRPSDAASRVRRIRATYKRRMRTADTLATLTWLSVAAVIALFFADGGAAQFGTATQITSSLGILTGLVGSDLLLVMLLLAARLPLIDRVFGHDKAMAVHQTLGKPALYLILGHGLFLTISYALAEKVNIFTETVTIFSTMNDMPLAYLALGLMVAVVVSSIVVVRRRLRYEAWHAVHLLAYLSVLVAIPHQLNSGALLADGTIARYYWLALYAGVAGAILVFRFIVPVVNSVRHRLVVVGVDREAPGVVSVRMTGHRLQALDARAGQFFIWRFWAPGMWWQAHPFSLSSAPVGDDLRITVRALGDFSAGLPALKKGTRVSFEGPYGLFTDQARTSPRLVLIAAGIGAPPIRSLLETADFAPGQATVILRSHTVGDSYLASEIADLCQQRGAELRIITGKRPKGVDSWLPEDAWKAGITLKTLVPKLGEADVYICGPRPWTDAVVRDARSSGLPTKQIHFERFDW